MDLQEKIAARKRELATELASQAADKSDAEWEARTKVMFADAAASSSSEFKARVDEEVALRLTEMGIDPKTRQPFAFDKLVNQRVEAAISKEARRRVWKAHPFAWFIAGVFTFLTVPVSPIITIGLAGCMWFVFSDSVKKHRANLIAEGEAAKAKGPSLDVTVDAPRSEQVAQLPPALTQADAQGSVGFVPWKEQAQDPINHNSNHQEGK